MRGAERILAGVRRGADNPRLFVLRRVKDHAAGQQLEENRLADVLGVLRGFQIGVGQTQDHVGVGLHQTFRLRPVDWFH